MLRIFRSPHFVSEDDAGKPDPLSSVQNTVMTMLTKDFWRCSIALYYYSSQEAARFSGDTNVYWQQHGSQTGIDRLRIRLYRVFTRAARRLSRMAHQANPNKESR
jgi:hypothetical protein